MILKSIKLRKRLPKLPVYNNFEQISCQKITKNMFGIKFSLETFTGSSRHFCDCDFVKISKLKKIHPHNVFRLYLSLRSCTEASGFDVGRHICVQIHKSRYVRSFCDSMHTCDLPHRNQTLLGRTSN